MADVEQPLSIVIIKTLFVSLFTILSIVENFCVLYAIKKFKILRTVPNYFIASLSLADFLYAIFGGTSIVATTVSNGWVLGVPYCDFIGITNSLFCTASIATLVAISVNRYIAVSKPFQVTKICTSRNTFFTIIMIWLLSFLFSAPPLIGWSDFIAGSNYCIIDIRTHPSYTIMLTVTYYISPAILQPIFYFKIYKILKMRHNILGTDLDRSYRNKSKIHPMPVKQVNEFRIGKNQGDIYNRVNKNPRSVEKYTINYSGDYNKDSNQNGDFKKAKVICSNSVELPDDAKRSCITKNRSERIELYRILKHEARTTATMVAVVIAFYVCWTPLGITAFLYVFDRPLRGFGFATFAFVFTCMNGVINPLIYGVMNKQFRKAYKKMFRCC